MKLNTAQKEWLLTIGFVRRNTGKYPEFMLKVTDLLKITIKLNGAASINNHLIRKLSSIQEIETLLRTLDICYCSALEGLACQTCNDRHKVLKERRIQRYGCKKGVIEYRIGKYKEF